MGIKCHQISLHIEFVKWNHNVSDFPGLKKKEVFFILFRYFIFFQTTLLWWNQIVLIKSGNLLIKRSLFFPTSFSSIFSSIYHHFFKMGLWNVQSGFESSSFKDSFVFIYIFKVWDLHRNTCLWLSLFYPSYSCYLWCHISLEVQTTQVLSSDFTPYLCNILESNGDLHLAVKAGSLKRRSRKWIHFCSISILRHYTHAAY